MQNRIIKGLFFVTILFFSTYNIMQAEFSTLSSSYSTLVKCQDDRDKYEKTYPQFTRSSCFVNDNKYYYKLCEEGDSCTNDFSSISNINSTGSLGNYWYLSWSINPYYNEVSSSIRLQVNKLIKWLENKRDTSTYSVFDSYLKKFSDKLDELSSKYKWELQIQNIISYLRFELERVKYDLEKLKNKDNLDKFICELTWNCGEFSCIWEKPTNSLFFDVEENEGLTSNTAVTYSSTDTSKKCQYTCKEWFLGENCTSIAGTTIGWDKDEHGCLISAWYSWCVLKNKCLRSWEENCTSIERKQFTNPKRLWLPIMASQKDADQFCKEEWYPVWVITSSWSSNTAWWNGTSRWSNPKWEKWANTPWISSISCQTGANPQKYNCTGTIPFNTHMWDTEESDSLTSDTSVTYSSTDTSVKCQYTCNEWFSGADCNTPKITETIIGPGNNYSCAEKPSYPNATFYIWTPSSINQKWVLSDLEVMQQWMVSDNWVLRGDSSSSSKGCFYICKSWFTGIDCNTPKITETIIGPGNNYSCAQQPNYPNANFYIWTPKLVNQKWFLRDSTSRTDYSCSYTCKPWYGHADCNTPSSSIPCAPKPNYPNANFITWTPTSDNQKWVLRNESTNTSNGCYYTCKSWYTGNTCETVTVNWRCWSANWKVATSIPTSNLCSSGTASRVVQINPTTWTWTCGWIGYWMSYEKCSTLWGSRDTLYSCATEKPNYPHATFSTWFPSSVNQKWVLRYSTSAGSSGCYYTCKSWYSGLRCNIWANGIEYYCAQQPNYPNATFYTWTPSSDSQRWVLRNSSSSGSNGCYYMCKSWYGGDDCNTSIVNWRCWSVNWIVVSVKPTYNLCSAWTASAVTWVGPWTWTCIWTTTASCKTLK